jgi:hypothetical protein
MSGNKVDLSQVDELILASNTTVLGAGALFVSTPVSVLGYTHISGFAFSNVASAVNGLIIEQGYQATDFPAGTPATSLITRSLYGISAADMDNNAFAVQIVAPFARIIYTNGAAAQATFRLFFGARILRGL